MKNIIKLILKKIKCKIFCCYKSSCSLNESIENIKENNDDFIIKISDV